MILAVSYALKGVTFVVKAQSLDEKPMIARIKDDPGNIPSAALKGKKRKGDFLREIKPGDVIYTDHGGAGDRFVLAATAYGAVVRRVPSWKLPPKRVDEVLAATGWEAGLERPYGEETGEKLTDRKKRAMAFWITAKNEPHLYEEITERDLSVLQVNIAFRSYWRMKHGTMRAAQGLIAGYNDLALLELALTRQGSARINEEAIYNSLIERIAEDLLGGEMNATERADFVAAIGAEFPSGFPRHPSFEDVERLVDVVLNTDRFHATTLVRLKNAEKRLERLLKGGSEGRGKAKVAFEASYVWSHAFAKYPGMGTLIASRIIASIGDIRRFRSRPNLTAYAGYHHFEDGSRARRVKGRASNWSRLLKQGVWLWCTQTVKTPTMVVGDRKIPNPWRQKLDSRKAYELYKLLFARQRKVADDGLAYVILPQKWAVMPVRKSVIGFTPADYQELAGHVDELRKLAGVTSSDDEEEGTDDESAEASKVKDPVLAKLVAGVKASAHNKALRWLGQQLIKDIFKTWNAAIATTDDGLKPEPVRPSTYPVIAENAPAV